MPGVGWMTFKYMDNRLDIKSHLAITLFLGNGNWLYNRSHKFVLSTVSNFIWGFSAHILQVSLIDSSSRMVVAVPVKVTLEDVDKVYWYQTTTKHSITYKNALIFMSSCWITNVCLLFYMYLTKWYILKLTLAVASSCGMKHCVWGLLPVVDWTR